MRQTVRHHAAKIRPNLRALFAFLIFLSIFSLPARADEANASARRETVKTQFDRAEQSRQKLEAKPESSRTLKDYSSLVSDYRRVTLVTPKAPEVPTALNQIAELYRSMGDLFDTKYYQASIDAFQFLLRGYPTSRYREDALLSIARIEEDDLHDAVLAQKNYEQFLALHPHSSHAAEVRIALGKLTAKHEAPKPIPQPSTARDRVDQPPPKTVSFQKTSPATDTNQGAAEAPSSNSSGPRVSRIRTWNADTYTRVVIDVGSEVKYQAARITNPDRIYFDIEGAKVAPALLHGQIEVQHGGFLKTVRVAQNKSGLARVVLEVNQVKDYSVFLMPNPYRLIVDVYGTSAGAEAAARASAPPPGPTAIDAPSMKLDQPVAKVTLKTRDKKANAQVAAVPHSESASSDSAPSPEASSEPKSNAEVPAKSSPKATEKSAAKVSSKDTSRPTTAPDETGDNPSQVLSSARANVDDPSESSVRPATVRLKSAAHSTKSAHDEAEEMGPPPTPELTRDGQHSLTRALGLKIGRIVIDPGHGGHDTGTIGPTGLMEKDLCLDVSLRVGKLIQQRLPGAEVVYTREDDTFIPLEHRTEIANDAKADLFLSVHANSSQDHSARGIETYYLNFTGSSDAMEVASRENALSENGVHDLQTLVTKIARNEKIEESRDFAGIIQDSLSKRMAGLNHGERNRGVRKAPFVVLIGADMPSVLAEISFLSNPTDEQWLKKPENRQRVAEGLYRGIENYLQSTNSLANNQSHPNPSSRLGIVARSGNSQ